MPSNRQTKEANARKEAFLKAYAAMGNLTVACAAAQVPRSTVRRWRDADRNFAARFEEAMDEAADMLEAEAVRRAKMGVDEDVYYGGEVVGKRKVFSDNLLMFLLRGFRPEKYRENVEHSGTVSLTPLTPEQAERAKRIAMRRLPSGEATPVAGSDD
jgi:hypothetical protein